MGPPAEPTFGETKGGGLEPTEPYASYASAITKVAGLSEIFVQQNFLHIYGIYMCVCMYVAIHSGRSIQGCKGIPMHLALRSKEPPSLAIYRTKKTAAMAHLSML